MATEIILADDFRKELRKIASDQFETRTLSSEIANANVAYAIACIGAELGLSPLQSLRGIYMVKGKPIIGAQAMHAIVVRRRDVCEYMMLVESSSQKATYETKRVGDPRPTQLSYTIEEARAAGLTSNGVWKHAAAMLRNRCIAALCRAVYPDLVMGIYEESEGEEIRGDTREPVFVQASGDPNPLAHLEGRRFHTVPEPTPIEGSRVPPQLPAANPEPTGAFAPTEEERTKARIAELSAKLTHAESIAELDNLRVAITNEPEAVRVPLRQLYAERKQALAAANGQPA